MQTKPVAESSVSVQKPAIDPANRRTSERRAVNVGVTMLGESNFYLGLSENLSEGGLFVATHCLLPIGTTVTLEFTIPTAERPIVVEGEVRWVRSPNAIARQDANFAADESSTIQPGMGIRFVRVSKEDEALVLQFFRERTPEFYDE